MAGFQTDASRVTDSDNNHAARGAFSARIFFLWEMERPPTDAA
jgi:hypothetical protein